MRKWIPALALLAGCGGGDGNVGNYPPPDEVIFTDPTISGFIKGASSWITAVRKHPDGHFVRENLSKIDPITGYYEMELPQGEYAFIVLDDNGNLVGFLEDGQGKPLVINVVQSLRVDMDFSRDTDGDGLREGVVISEGVPTAVSVGFEVDANQNGIWDFGELMETKYVYLNTYQLWLDGLTLPEPFRFNKGPIFDQNGNQIGELTMFDDVRRRWSAFGSGFVDAPLADPDYRYISGTVGTVQGPDGNPRGCPQGLGPPIHIKDVYYVVYNPAYPKSYTEYLAEYLEKAISRLNELTGKKVLVYGGILPMPQNGYINAYCNRYRLGLFVIEDLREGIVGYATGCGYLRFIEVFIPATGTTYNYTSPSSVVAKIDPSGLDYSTVAHELGHFLTSLGHPKGYDPSYCNLPSVMHDPSDGCNRTYDFSTEDATEIGSWWDLVEQFGQYVVYPETLQTVYNRIPECQ